MAPESKTEDTIKVKHNFEETTQLPAFNGTSTLNTELDDGYASIDDQDHLKKLTSASQSKLTIQDKQYFDELQIHGELIVDTINGIPIQQLVYSNQDLNLTKIIVHEIVVRKNETFDKLKQNLRKTATLDYEDPLVAEDSKSNLPYLVYASNVDRIEVTAIQVDGLINKLSFQELHENSLKINNENQVLLGTLNLKEVKTNNLFVENGVISGSNIKDIILIKNVSMGTTATASPHYNITQDVRFSQPVFINELTIVERMNNVHVNKGQLDVLLKNSEDEQLITGHKQFRSVKLLEPIVLQGKLLKSSLNRMNPIVSINEDIEIKGKHNVNRKILTFIGKHFFFKYFVLTNIFY